MRSKFLFVSVMCLAVSLFLLTSCSEEPAPPEARAGTWKAEVDFGEFNFMVDETGTKILSIHYKFDKGGLVVESTMDGGENPWSIDEEGKFSFFVLTLVDGITLEGQFNVSQTNATGICEVPDAGSQNWVATKTEIAD